jgi:O-antigen ligase
MTSELIHSIASEKKEERRKSVILKLLISFIFLIINVETISYLLLRNDTLITLYQKVLFSIVLVLSIFRFFKWNKTDRICFLVFILLLVKLIINSLVGYSSILVYPSVLAVIFPFLYVYFVKNLFKTLNIDIFKILITFIFLGYFVFMLFYGHDFDFSNSPILIEEAGPYSGDTRILHANSILLIELPFLYFFNKILSARKSLFSTAGFIISLIIIVIHQHRTVWITTIISCLLLLFIKGFNKKVLRKLLFFTILIVVTFTLLVVTIPGLSQLLTERFLDVLDPLNEDNTGGFRYLQILAYLNYFIQKPLFGWTFSGFELSNPFLTDNWEEGSGHHFHNAYIEVLFYFGITGFFLKFYPLYSVAKRIKKQLTDKSKILAAFSVSGFVYAFSYVPPLIFWGIAGLCLYYIEKDLKTNSYNQVQQNNE